MADLQRSMQKVTLVRGARQLLTLHGPDSPRRGADLSNLAIIQDGAILIVDGQIREVGSTRRVENLALARQADEIDASGRVVLPGFVDSDTHLVRGPVRIPGQFRASADLSPHTVEALAVRALEDAVRHGTTALEAKSGEMKILRVHSHLQKRPVSLISTFSIPTMGPKIKEGDAYLESVWRHLLLIKRRKLAEFAEIGREADHFTEAQACRYLTSARQLGFGLKVHSGPNPNAGAIRLAVEFGATTVDHVINPSEQEIALLAQSATIATLCPGPVFFQGTENYPPARALIDSGAAIALGTGYSPETSPSQNMQMTIALACLRMNMTPAEAIAAATINAVYAVGRASCAGSLEIGKAADLLILSVSDYREIPYRFGVNLVDLVMKAGVVLMERSEVKWPVN